MNHCCVISCLNGRKNKTHKFFNFPPDPDRCAKWVEFCHHPSISERLTASGPYSLAKYGICSEHFDPAIVEEVMRKKIRLPADAVPDRIGRTFMTQKMLLDRGFSLDNYNLSSEGCRRLERSPVKHIDAVLVEMLDPDEMKQETAEEGSNFEFVRLKSDHQQFKFEDGFKKEYVDPGASHQPKKKCKMCSNFKPRYQYEVKKNKNLEEQINENKKQIADMSTKLQKMHDRITLRKARREELRKKYTELKNQKRGKGTTSLDISAEEANAADSEDDDASFDEATAWWKFEQAMEVIAKNGGKYSLVTVARLYLDHLLSLQQFDEAAKLCLRAFQNDKQLWEEEVYKFVKVKQLRSVSNYIPRSAECKLNPHVYEMVLYEYLQLDPEGFLHLVKEWQPGLYNTKAVINAINDHFNKKDANILLEALAILYSHDKEYDKALTMYLKLQHKDVFELIKNHNLYSVIKDTIVQLIELDSDKAIAMLMEKDKIPAEDVVKELESREDYLYRYLDAYDKTDNSGKFHWKLVTLYAKYDPSKLLTFLKRSNNYPIQEAFDICKQKLFYPEMVYLLGRMGNTREALSIIIHKLKDIQMAIDFCKEHDDMDLWKDLINESVDNPCIMTKLLDGIAGFINPEILVNKIKKGQEIPGLKNSIIKMLCGFSLQVAIQDGCNQILVTDYFNMHERLAKVQQGALPVTGDNTCGLCRRDIIVKDPPRTETDVVVFNCRHYFHENCLPDKYNTDHCTVCKSRKP